MENMVKTDKAERKVKILRTIKKHFISVYIIPW